MEDVPLKKTVYIHIYISVKAEKETNTTGYSPLRVW